ncbi:hypothetical protein PLAN_30250 [Planktothrix rubescens CCAP 1459/22]|uniref:Uncharacterized protein n=1 Tax=Planktothrix rubescens CCAP 1459/22 TaxID=329571 RepID=A0A6J7ZK01_PLARU|nr:hypothetical protein PLAN_30250 [Planktothrix rubescens NIVA-CYA 18]
MINIIALNLGKNLIGCDHTLTIFLEVIKLLSGQAAIAIGF